MAALRLGSCLWLALVTQMLWTVSAQDRRLLKDTVAELKLTVSEFVVDRHLFRCNNTRKSYKSGACYMTQRFCLGEGEQYGKIDAMMCMNGKIGDGSIAIWERKIKVAPDPLLAPKGKIPRGKMVDDGYRDCSDPGKCYPFDVPFKIPPHISTAASPLLFVVLAEDNMRYKGRPGSRSLFRIERKYNVPFPRLKPGALGKQGATAFASQPVALIPQKFCDSDDSPFLEKIKTSLVKLAHGHNKTEQLFRKVFNLFIGYWHGKDLSAQEATDTTLSSSIGEVCLTTGVRMRCLPDFGPPGDCSYKFLPCGKIVKLTDIAEARKKHLEQQQKEKQQQNGGRGKRSLTDPLNLCSTPEEETLSVGDKVTIGVSLGSVSVIISAVLFFLKKVWGAKKILKSPTSTDKVPVNCRRLQAVENDTCHEVDAPTDRLIPASDPDYESTVSDTESYETVQVCGDRILYKM